MATLNTILERATTILNDHEEGFINTTWSKAELLGWAQEALEHIAELRPDNFTTTMNIPLRPGSAQEAPEGVRAVLDVFGNVRANADGSTEISDDVSSVDQNLIRRFKKKRCLPEDDDGVCGDPGDNYRVTNFIRDPFNMRRFRVEPPVPEGANVEVSASVILIPSVEEGSLDDEIGVSATAVLHWVLMRAYAKDMESEFATRERAFYYSAFYSALGEGYFADSRISSGFHLGLEGHGDPRSGAPRELRKISGGAA
ncbi:MAG: hypothetical protein DI640_12875 [Sphingomonas taxi]|uniref:Uncharacterized protein n=1 Tax=Sphingomonas taxi TaxID=1549858 RepID=A0A2W4YVI9_9SPHN|nr:MAG: hypothetical protein DI640_12875 [Sphingomonas taxi]